MFHTPSNGYNVKNGCPSVECR